MPVGLVHTEGFRALDSLGPAVAADGLGEQVFSLDPAMATKKLKLDVSTRKKRDQVAKRLTQADCMTVSAPISPTI
jgi:Ni,Fe-hydrogenase III large subunit